MLYFGATMHDVTYVLASVIICLLSSWAVFYSIVRDAPGLRRMISVTVFAGLGVWSTHFVAVLGLRPDFLIEYSIPETLGSMLLAIIAIGGALAIATAAKRLIPALLAGSIAGIGISAMHHLGMYGLSGCIVRFDTFAVIATTLTAMAFSMLAIAVSRSFIRGRIFLASLLFGAGVATVHFGSIIATSFQVGDAAPWVMSGLLLAVCQFVAVLVLMSPAFRIVRQQVTYYRESAFSGQVAKATDEGIVTMDAKGSVTWANDAFLRMTGLDREEILNVDSIEVVTKLASLEDADTYQHAIRTGGKASIDVSINQGGGEQRWQRVRLIPKRAENGELAGFVSAHQDTTTEKIALERLRASEAEASRLAIVAEHATDAILITDAHGGTMWVNASFQRLSGYTLDEMLGRKPGEVLQCKDTDPATVRAIREALTDARPIRTEIMNANKDGDTYWTELEISPVKRDGEPLRFIAVSRNVSERIQREQYLKEARRKAEAADEMKSEFLARMSHEIRTPMNGVTGLTEVLSTTDLNDVQTKYVAHIRECSAQLLRVVNDVLDFSSIAKGEVSLSKAEFDLKEVADEALSVVSLAAKEKGLALTLDIDTIPSGAFWGDKDRLKQVLLNLLSNAVKFTNAGSVTLKITSEAKGASDPDECGRFVFSVTDTGVGIPPDMQEHVFEPFRQLEESATRSYEGTGLGLSIAKDIVTAMGGRMTLESEVGEGSTFAFSLSFEAEQDATVRAA